MSNWIHVILAAFVLLAVLLVTSNCAHIPKTCDAYCLSRGGLCDYIEHGSTRYNTKTEATDERPTVFVCKYNW